MPFKPPRAGDVIGDYRPSREWSSRPPRGNDERELKGWEPPPSALYPRGPQVPREFQPRFRGGYRLRTLPRSTPNTMGQWGKEEFKEEGKNPYNQNPIVEEDPPGLQPPFSPGEHDPGSWEHRLQLQKRPGLSLGAMEQYRLEPIEMTDLGQDAAWSQEMQKALEEDVKHEHHTAAPIGEGYTESGGRKVTRYAGGRGFGDRYADGGGAAADSGATTQGAPGDINAGAVTAVGGGPPKAFIMHHTGGRGTAAGVQSVLRQRGLGVQYVMDRDGNITRIGGPGAHHILRGTGVGAGLSNRNVVGMEVIAKNDADVTPAQVAAAKRFISKYYPRTPVFGHGEVNPGHKEATEGMTITRAIRRERAEGGTAALPTTARETIRTTDEFTRRDTTRVKNLFHRAVTPREVHNRVNRLIHRATHAHPHPRHFPSPMRRSASASATPTPPSRSFAGVQGLPGSPSGPEPERP